MLTVLQVAYPMAPVGEDAVGGAEQVLSMLDEALVEHGHRSIVVACEGSTVRGTLLATPRVRGSSADVRTWAAAHDGHRAAIAEALRRWPVDVVHLHGADWYRYLPAADVPVLVTLHLPPSWYPEEALRPTRPRTLLHCVSPSQHRACPPSGALLPPIRNGVSVRRMHAAVRRRDLCASLGRICPEKGFHMAIDAARRADAPFLLAGCVFPYDEHRRYWDAEIAPRLDARRRFVGPVTFRGKRRLLSAARCLLVPSLAPETSSLVAMEAMACGTPVIAFAAGALRDIVAHERTGFLVRDTREMADAIAAARSIDGDECRREAEERFSAERAARAYLARYEWLAAGGTDALDRTDGTMADARA
ncbi:MAG TPA: glycosyltransferase [Gemmatimonadaceae bacterium]|nr:glycosyltransferase [Gemmatimonadaceae bacterium]